MKAFYTERTEDNFRVEWKVWDYYQKQPVCIINPEFSDRKAEYYADKIAMALNEAMPTKR